MYGPRSTTPQPSRGASGHRKWCIMCQPEAAVRDNPRAAILAGIKEYLREQFPDIQFTEQPEWRRTDNVLLVGGAEGGYRVAVTETFLRGEQGADEALAWIREWNVALAIRESGGWLVVITTEGIRLEG
jgi:hypothetical protein